MLDGMTLTAMMARLEEHGLRYGVFELQNGVRTLVVERGGRVYGPFLDDDRPGIFWINPAWKSAADFGAFLATGFWNQGGERLWISPETQYLVSDRNDFWGTVAVPPPMDPGTWQLDQPQAGQWRLRQELTMQAYNLATGTKSLRVERRLRPALDPLAASDAAAELLDGVIYAGYEQTVTLAEDRLDAITSQVWNLIQLQAGGEILVPCTPELEVTDYNEPVDDQHLMRHEHWATFRITGTRRYKVGLRAAQLFGRAGYFHRLDDEHACLLVRCYFNNPSTLYTEEPAHLPGRRGDALHIYNDGGMFGGFGELEVQGQTIGGSTGLSTVTDQQLLWIYSGDPAKVAAIARQLLGVTA